jgi:misacylated tRNA(Ala) deacylase
MTARLYLRDSYRQGFEADVVESERGWCTLSRTAFYPGGGGQPPDRGDLRLGSRVVPVTALREDDAGRIWHRVGDDLAVGDAVQGVIDWPFRYALMRHHGLMHVVNTVAGRLFGGVITGVQIGPHRSRIDFRLGDFARARVADFERHVNDAIERNLRVTSTCIGESEYRRRPELIRTLNVQPPIVEGRIRIVEIEGFDAQACGGTHVHATGEIGRARLDRFDNKGKDNKRFYWDLSPPA